MEKPRTEIYTFKLVLLGDSAVGKSSIVMRFVRGDFLEFHDATIGAAFLSNIIQVDNYQVKYEIWDTAGQERYHSLAPMYYRGSAAAIVVYDITSYQSYERAKQWIKELQLQIIQYKNKKCPKSIVIALAGNKIDLIDKKQVPEEEALKYAQENGLLFVETSAKTGQNVREIFETIGQQLPKVTPDNQDTIKIDTSSLNNTKKCC